MNRQAIENYYSCGMVPFPRCFMNLNEASQIILHGIQAAIEEFRNPRYGSFHRNRTGLLMLECHNMAHEGWCRFEPAVWIGHSLNAGERKLFSLALKSLESGGLIVTERDDRYRIAWVGLTKAGVEHAGQK